ncbi:MAG: hypothetical protein ACPGVZ_11035 [Myxococcota bacterium]
MGLIAREVEARGIPTVSLSSARSITASVNPPRGVHTDYPLGRTAGKPKDPASQDAILRAAVAQLAEATVPGEIRSLDLRWSENDDWKDGVMRPKSPASEGGAVEAEDDRAERTDVPQYQFEADREAVEPNCPTCLVPGAA